MRTFWGSIAVGAVMALLALFEEQLELRSLIGFESYLAYVVTLTMILFTLVTLTCFIASRGLKDEAV